MSQVKLRRDTSGRMRIDPLSVNTFRTETPNVANQALARFQNAAAVLWFRRRVVRYKAGRE